MKKKQISLYLDSDRQKKLQTLEDNSIYLKRNSILELALDNLYTSVKNGEKYHNFKLIIEKAVELPACPDCRCPSTELIDGTDSFYQCLNDECNTKFNGSLGDL